MFINETYFTPLVTSVLLLNVFIVFGNENLWDLLEDELHIIVKFN